MNTTKISSRAVVQMVYRPTLQYLDTLVSQSKVYQKDFENWIYDSPKQLVVLFDVEKKIRFTVTPQQVELVIENPESAQAVIDELAKVWAIFFADSDVEDFGTATSLLLSLDNADATYTEYSAKYFEKYYSYGDDFKSAFADEIFDVVQILEGVKDGYNTKMRFAPLKAEQIEATYPIENYSQSGEYTPKKGVAIFSDSAVIMTLETPKAEIVDKVEKAIKMNFTIHDNVAGLSRL